MIRSRIWSVHQAGHSGATIEMADPCEVGLAWSTIQQPKRGSGSEREKKKGYFRFWDCGTHVGHLFFIKSLHLEKGAWATLFDGSDLGS